MTNETVTIHIDKTKFTSPAPTTGAALYILGNVPAKYDLFEEVHGPGDDNLIANDGTAVNLKNGLHFYSIKQTLNPGNVR